MLDEATDCWRPRLFLSDGEKRIMARARGPLSDPVVRCAGLQRHATHDAAALQDITIETPRGAIYAVTGPTGSGKSTLLRLIVGSLRAANGLVLVNDTDVAENADAILPFTNYLAQMDDAPPGISPGALLYFTGTLRGMPPQEARNAARDLLERAQLTAVARRPLGTLLPAQRQLVRCCAALMGYPHLLILDDPLRDLDMVQRDWFWGILRQLHDTTGVTTILTTRDIAEAEHHITHLAYLRAGQLLAAGTPARLIEQYGAGPRMEIMLTPGARITEEMRKRLRALGSLTERDATALVLYPKPDVIGMLAQPAAVPAEVRQRRKNSATIAPTASNTPRGANDDSWLLDRSVLPGSLGRTVEEIFTIIGPGQIGAFWFAPPTLVDVYHRLEGGTL